MKKCTINYNEPINYTKSAYTEYTKKLCEPINLTLELCCSPYSVYKNEFGFNFLLKQCS